MTHESVWSNVYRKNAGKEKEKKRGTGKEDSKKEGKDLPKPLKILGGPGRSKSKKRTGVLWSEKNNRGGEDKKKLKNLTRKRQNPSVKKWLKKNKGVLRKKQAVWARSNKMHKQSSGGEIP